jgi:hypothetical protein
MTSLDSHQSDEHDDVFLLLPWYANRSLDGDEAAHVEKHVRHCMACRRELTALQALATAIARESVSGQSADVSYAHFAARLPQRPNATTGRQRWLTRWNRSGALRLAAAAALLLAVLPLGLWQWEVQQPPSFRTLAQPGPSRKVAGDFRVVFAVNLPADRIDALLREVDGRLVAGPNGAGAYTVRLGENGKPVAPAVALARLRAHEGVVLAEPVTWTD